MDTFCAYLAPPGFQAELLHELANVTGVRDRLVLAQGPCQYPAWAENIWLDPRFIPIRSITDGAARLKEVQRNWALFSTDFHRRAALIQEKLPKVSAKPLAFGDPAPDAPLGSWTLWDKDLILASPACASPFPNGQVRFVEDKTGPPNRAYLKLWELFTLLGEHPGKDDFCYDLGASPGGWTWVLAKLGARVTSLDKAPLDPDVAALPGVEHRLMSAFALEPRKAEPADWLFCDVACYPARLLAMVKRWLEEGAAKRLVCTLKFQAETDHAAAREFAAIPGSVLTHLHNNKHELTWVCYAEQGVLPPGCRVNSLARPSFP